MSGINGDGEVVVLALIAVIMGRGVQLTLGRGRVARGRQLRSAPRPPAPIGEIML